MCASPYKILKREQYGPVTFLWEVHAPFVARAARPGHFLMVRIDDTGERIPLTVADFDRERGTVTVVIQAVGKTTRQMMALQEGAGVLDFVGPLGVPSHIAKAGKVVVVGGGLGVAPIFPQLRAYKEAGNTTISIIGFRSAELVFWEEKFRRFSDELILTTDDGSRGMKGFVTHALQKVLDATPDVALVMAIGPLVMMRACAELTRPRSIPTLVSLNSIMVDGTGMCGSCRVTVDGLMRFACVDGPDFDGHKVSFEELMLRQKRFEREEKEALDRLRARERGRRRPVLAGQRPDVVRVGAPRARGRRRRPARLVRPAHDAPPARADSRARPGRGGHREDDPDDPPEPDPDARAAGPGPRAGTSRR